MTERARRNHPKTDRTCQQCGTTFRGSQLTLYCSVPCRRAVEMDRRRSSPIATRCEDCQLPARARHLCNRCYQTRRRAGSQLPPPLRQPRTSRPCACGDGEVEAQDRCRKCYDRDRRTGKITTAKTTPKHLRVYTRVCTYCGVKYEGRSTTGYCSAECKRSMDKDRELAGWVREVSMTPAEIERVFDADRKRECAMAWEKA